MGAIRRELSNRRQARRAARATEQGIAGHQAAMGALGRIKADITAKNEAANKDPWGPSDTSTDYRTAVFSKDSEGNTFMNNVRKVRGGSKEKNNGN
jgi:hypothetical protein